MSAEDRLVEQGAVLVHKGEKPVIHTRPVHRRAPRSGVVGQSSKIEVFATSVVLGQMSARAQGKLVPGPHGERAAKTTKRVAVAFWRNRDTVHGDARDHPLRLWAAPGG